MPIIRWAPLNSITESRERLSRLLNENLGYGYAEEGMHTGSWIPPVDIYETDQNVILKAELPGVNAQDVEVRVHDGTLYLKGERKYEHEVKEENFRHVERSYGSFTRTFSLTASVDADKVKADFKDGVLTLTMPKREEAKPKAIQINVSK